MTKQMNTLPKYRYLTKEEEERTIILCLEKLLDKTIPFAGKHRKEQWEKGWAENLEAGNGTPKYFGKYKVNRLNGRFIIAEDKDWEIRNLHKLVWDVTKKYFRKLDNIYEFGCGIGHNLWVIRDYMSVANPEAKIYGLDWTKSGTQMVKSMGFHSHVFNFFEPNYSFGLGTNSGVLTVAALEQTGTDYKKFVQYLLKKKPEVVVHIEPIPELLDSTKLLDYLSIQYMHKRNYLRGYVDYLEELEKKGKLKIIEKRRSGIGSLLIDGYSVIVWRPL